MGKFSLDTLRSNPDFAALFAQKAGEIRELKGNLVESAREYQDRYHDEIERGTLKRQLMLDEGKRQGKTEEEVFKDQALFIPSKTTPLLNYLYFLLRETKAEDLDIKVLRGAGDENRDLQLLKEEYEQKYGAQMHADHDNTLPNMVKFVYGNVDHDTFNTIKKLKTLSQSPNSAEAFGAYRKCLELCKKFNLEFDKIPVNN